ncbi:MAG: choice-of-anchor tandem repeat GloVer-containing protein [Candidatus Sulfotelmatobacter sp.]|jgi:uncharacterized repeat protein (TIGR03803 family)
MHLLRFVRLGQLNWWGKICALLLLCATTAIVSPAQNILTVLASFNGTNGIYPEYVSLVQGFDGNFYGTTSLGGTNCPAPASCCGTVFKITAAGALTTLYSFCSQTNSEGYCADGSSPDAGLVQATDGNLYGTTQYGGANNDGTVFQITSGGTLTTLYSFCAQTGCTDGSQPVAGLLQGTNGSFYGATATGGANGEGGTIFKITAAGATTLYSFCSRTNSEGYCADGSSPDAGLVEATNGNLYGTTQYGGANNDGTVFQITPGGTLTTLYSFCAQPVRAAQRDAVTKVTNLRSVRQLSW